MLPNSPHGTELKQKQLLSLLLLCFVKYKGEVLFFITVVLPKNQFSLFMEEQFPDEHNYSHVVLPEQTQ